MELIKKFYKDIIDYYKIDPTSNKISLIWKEEFNSYKKELEGKKIREFLEEGILNFYDPVMNSISNLENHLIHICDSQDLKEDVIYGDYSYYYGFITKDIPILYMKPSHEWTFPTRVTFYGKEYQFTVNSNSPYIYIYEVNPSVRKIFFGNNKLTRIKNFLLNTDRPLLDLNFK